MKMIVLFISMWIIPESSRAGSVVTPASGEARVLSASVNANTLSVLTSQEQVLISLQDLKVMGVDPVTLAINLINTENIKLSCDPLNSVRQSNESSSITCRSNSIAISIEHSVSTQPTSALITITPAQSRRQYSVTVE